MKGTLHSCRLLLTAWLATASQAAAELPRYSVTPLEEWGGEVDPGGVGIYGVALNTQNELLANDFRFGNYGAGLQMWLQGTRTDPGPPAYPPGYEYSVGHLRAFTDAGTWAVDAYSSSLDRHRLVALDLRTATSAILPDIPGAVMDGSAPALSSGGNFLVARSDDFTRGWRLALGSNTWGELLGPGSYVQPDAVNNLGMAAGRMGGAGGGTVPFYSTAAGEVHAITAGGTALFGEATAINNAGLVTGTGNGRAFLFDSNTMELRYLSETVIGVRPVDINEAGAILGISGSGAISFVTLYGEDFGLVSLSSLLEGNEDPFHPAWLMKDAVDINDAGWILGSAQRVSDNTFHQVLLRPVPEPGVTGLSVLAVVLVLRRRTGR